MVTARRADGGTSPPAASPDDAAMRCVIAYLRELGVGEASAQRVAEALSRRIDPDTAASGRVVAMLEALDRWADQLPETLGLERETAHVAFALARRLGAWLDAKPHAIADPTLLLDELRRELDAWPQGLLPTLPHQTMHRQPLGDLPAVLRSAFWSGTYRWVLPPQAGRGVAQATPKDNR